MSNYATKADLKLQQVLIQISLKKTCLANKLNNVPSNLSNLKSKIDKLYVDKLIPDAIDLSKLSDLVKNDVVRKDVYNTCC